MLLFYSVDSTKQAAKRRETKRRRRRKQPVTDTNSCSIGVEWVAFCLLLLFAKNLTRDFECKQQRGHSCKYTVGMNACNIIKN